MRIWHFIYCQPQGKPHALNIDVLALDIAFALYVFVGGHRAADVYASSRLSLSLTSFTRSSATSTNSVHDDEAPLPHAGLLLILREPEPHTPDRVATFIDSEGNGFELRQHVGSQSDG